MKTDLLEAILFLESDGINLATLTSLLACSKEETKAALQEFSKDLQTSHRGIQLVQQGATYRLKPASHLLPQLLPKYRRQKRPSLSPAVMETLSIIAYTQPTTRVEIEGLRGVSVDASLQYLLQEEYIRKDGKREVPGNPDLYVTTTRFLRVFGLNSLEELPALDPVDAMRFQKDESS